jgi:hypothetical protein
MADRPPMFQLRRMPRLSRKTQGIVARLLVGRRPSRMLALACLPAMWMARPLVAQDTSALRPLAIPAAAVLRCRAEAVSPATSDGGRRFRFSIGEGGWRAQREIEVTYDSAGVPQSLLETVSRMSTDGRSVVEGIAATFGSGRVVAGFHTRDERTALQSAPARRERGRTLPPLSAEESRDTAHLAEWLWARRCGKRDGINAKNEGSSGG